MFYGLDPKASLIAAQAEQWLLFEAHTTGGSGWAFHVALLRYRSTPKPQLQNLLPDAEFSNMDEWQTLTLPGVSPYPLFISGRNQWVELGHYSPHRYEVEIFRFDPASGRYKPLTKYETRKRYSVNKQSRGDVLGPEWQNIMDHLQRFAHH